MRSKRRLESCWVEREALVQRIPGLLDGLTEDQRRRLLSIGQKRNFEAEQALFSQGDAHDGIYLIESGRIRSCYMGRGENNANGMSFAAAGQMAHGVRQTEGFDGSSALRPAASPASVSS